MVCISAAMLPVVLLVLAQQLRKHGNLPLLRWSADNTVVVPRALHMPRPVAVVRIGIAIERLQRRVQRRTKDSKVEVDESGKFH